MTRLLIVNADDFGRSPGINEGVAQGHEQGIVTSASLMVRWPAAIEAAAYARANPALSVGLHVDLGEWEHRGERWCKVYEVVPTENGSAVAAEIERQLRLFRELVGANPTHLDSHQHVHREEPAQTILRVLAGELRVPLRAEADGPRYCGDFYGQTAKGEPIVGGVSVGRLISILRNRPAGTTELGCHPAAYLDVESSYLAERVEELRSLCDGRVRQVLQREQIELGSFRLYASSPCSGSSLGRDERRVVAEARDE